MNSVRSAAVADLFYPGESGALAASVTQYMDQIPSDQHQRSAKAIIVPHAGYIYSGMTAAFAYAAIDRALVKRVVLFGPSHRVAFAGMALPDTSSFDTPLGQVPIDQKAVQKALAFPQVQVNEAAHALEHSLEVQLPFLQTVLADFEFLPVCVGSVQADVVAELMAGLWGDEETLIIISSDLSHYHPYQEARELDQQSLSSILNQQPILSHEQACGATAVNALLMIAAQKGVKAEQLDYRNSGDTAGDKDQVVGYASIGFYHDS